MRARAAAIARARSGAGRGRLGVHGQRPADPLGGVLQRAQHVLGLDRRRLPRYLRGHERVAVPVRADPAAEPQERRRGRGDAAGRRAGSARGPATGTAPGPRGTASRRTRSWRRGPRRAAAWPRPAAPTSATAGRSPPGACAGSPRARWRPSRPSSRLVSSAPIRRSASVTARRRASVGWAVRTGCTRSSGDQAEDAPGPVLGPDGRPPPAPAIRGPAGRRCRARAACGSADAPRPGWRGGSRR